MIKNNDAQNKAVQTYLSKYLAKEFMLRFHVDPDFQITESIMEAWFKRSVKETIDNLDKIILDDLPPSFTHKE